MDEFVYIWSNGVYCSKEHLTTLAGQHGDSYESVPADEFHNKSLEQWKKELFNV
jgi:hypothetical protein